MSYISLVLFATTYLRDFVRMLCIYTEARNDMISVWNLFVEGTFYRLLFIYSACLM